MVLIISFLDVTGWIFNLTVFKSIMPLWAPMKLFTSLCFAVSVIVLVILQADLPVFFSKILPMFLSAIICTVSIISLYIHIHIFITGNEPSITQQSSVVFFLAPSENMAFLTACNFLLLGSMLFLLLNNKAKASEIAHILVIPLFLISYFIIVSYTLGVYSATEINRIQVSLYTGIAFCSLTAAILFLRPDTWLLRLLISRNTAGIISRKLLPLLIILPIIIGWFRIHGERLAMFKSEEGVVLVAIAYTFCFLILTLLTARSIEKIDLKRRSVEESLRESEGRLKFHIENSPLAVIEWGHDFIVTKWSAEAERIFGWIKKEVVGMRIDELNMIFEEDIPLLRNNEEINWRKSIESGFRE